MTYNYTLWMRGIFLCDFLSKYFTILKIVYIDNLIFRTRLESIRHLLFDSLKINKTRAWKSKIVTRGISKDLRSVHFVPTLVEFHLDSIIRVI